MTSITTRRDVVKSIGEPLITLEQHIDAALVTHGAVLAAAITGREKARLPLDAGQHALERLMDASQQLIAARKAVHEAHYALRDVQAKMGVAPMSFGDHGDTPDSFTNPMGQETKHLTVVAA